MDKLIRYWNVNDGNLLHFESTSFQSNKSFNKGVKEAVRKLTKKIFESDVGSEIATREYGRVKRVIHAISFNEKGLIFLVNENEHTIDASQFSLEIQKVREALERQKLIPTTTNEKARAIFNQVIEERKAETNAPTLTSELRAGAEKIQEKIEEIRDVNSVKKAAAVMLAGIKIFEAFAILGGLILSISGLSLAKSSFNDAVSAQLHENLEKFFLACSDLFASLNVIATSALFLMEKIALMIHELGTAAFAGAALPVTVFMFYATSLLSSIYKLYVQMKFKSEFDALIGNGTENEIYAALVWLKQKTQNSQSEISQNDESGMFKALHKKWESFTLRVGHVVFQDLLDLQNINTLLSRWEGGDILEARILINTVKAANKNAIKWNLISIFANTLGVVGMSTYLAVAGHVGTVLSSTLFTLATLISLCVDYPKARQEIVECIRMVMLKIKEHCAKSEKSVETEGCSSKTSSTTSDQNEVFPQTLLKLTAETLAHSLAS